MAQLRDLIVTGAARFLNNIYGNLIGNASTADKVNHKFSISSGGATRNFDGSADIDVVIDARSLGLNDAMRIVGVVDQNYTQFDDINGTGSLVSSKLTIVDASQAAIHVIFLSEVISDNCNAQTIAIPGGGSATYYIPRVGDLVIQDEEEFICVSSKPEESIWRSTNGSGYWGKYG